MIWNRIATDLRIPSLTDIAHEITLYQLQETLENILKGQTTGRTVLNMKQ